MALTHPDSRGRFREYLRGKNARKTVTAEREGFETSMDGTAHTAFVTVDLRRRNQVICRSF